MPLPTLETLQRIGAATGYVPNTLEKVARILDMLAAINKDPALSGKLALKGGTALNVFHLELDRLSVDIDFNYIGARNKQDMQEDRPALENAIVNLINSKGCTVRHRPQGHGGGKWICRYASVLGGNASIACLRYPQASRRFLMLCWIAAKSIQACLKKSVRKHRLA